MDDEIPEASLHDRNVYRIYSRNLVVGVWHAAQREFIGIREKFGSEFLFGEYHAETGPPFGTARATRWLAKIPGGMAVNEDHENQVLFDFLKVVERPILDEIREINRRGEIEAESLRYRPQTKDEYDKDQRIEAVRQWRRDNPDAPWKDYTKRLMEAIKGDG